MSLYDFNPNFNHNILYRSDGETGFFFLHKEQFYFVPILFCVFLPIPNSFHLLLITWCVPPVLFHSLFKPCLSVHSVWQIVFVSMRASRDTRSPLLHIWQAAQFLCLPFQKKWKKQKLIGQTNSCNMLDVERPGSAACAITLQKICR